MIFYSNDTDIYACPNEDVRYTCIGDFTPHIWDVPGINRFVYLKNNGYHDIFWNTGKTYYLQATNRSPFTTNLYIPYVSMIKYSKVICSNFDNINKSTIYHQIYGKLSMYILLKINI